MNSKFLLLSFVFGAVFNHVVGAQSIHYKGNPFRGNPVFLPNHSYALNISILHEVASGKVVFSEKQQVVSDAENNFNIFIGAGKVIAGKIDSLIWSDGAYFLKFETDTGGHNKKYFSTILQLRANSEVNRDNLEGYVVDDSAKGYGLIHIPNPHHRRPKKITIDLTTSYINIDYKGGNYPIYRHYEWYDENGDGTGNAFMLTYSEKTSHEFIENTLKIGEVKLYETPFQELWLRKQDENEIIVELTKPKQIDQLNITYAIKGPWKIIYLIEW